jgi:hypothetical protein
MPIKLQKKINEKIVNSIGKYKDPFFFTFSDKTLKKMNSYRNSALVCQTFGTRVALAIAKLKNKKHTRQATTANIDELVIEKSKKPIKIGKTLLIENCSNGEKKVIKKV